MQKLKNRIVNFRVTDEEFASLKTASHLHGAACLSEFARAVMLGIAPPAELPSLCVSRIEEKIQSLDGRLTTIESDLSLLLNMFSFAQGFSRKS